MKRNKRWKRENQAEFLIKLGQLLEKGYTLPKAIEMVQLHQSPDVKVIFEDILTYLRAGFSLHSVLAEHKFPEHVLGYLSFSEKHGDLSFSLAESGKMMRKREEIKRRLLKTIRYPLFLMIIVIIIGVVFLQFLFPQFESLYQSLNIDFPLFTRLFIAFIHALPFIGLLALSFILLLFVYYFTTFRNYQPTKQVLMLQRIPLLRFFFPLLITHYFSIQLGTLLKGGLSIHEALNVFEKNDYLRFFQQEAIAMKTELLSGEGFERIVKAKKYFVPELSHIVAHGHANGTIGPELIDYGDMLMELFEEKVTRYFQIAQPVLFLIIGSTVFLMFVSMLLPMFELMSSIK